MKKTILNVLLLLALMSRAVAAAEFGIDQYLALSSISELSVSPAGRHVAYTLTSNDLAKDTTRNVVWIQATDGGDALRMTAADYSSSSPEWSPDGRYLAVLSDRKGDTSQVWLFDRRGGDPQQLTDLKQGVYNMEWSPDSQKILFLAKDPSAADLDEEERPNPRPFVIDRLQFKEDYVGYLDRSRTHVYVVGLEAREEQQLTFGDFDDSEPTWAPDSKRIVFVSNRTDNPDSNRNTDLWIIDSSLKNPTPRQLTRKATADASPAWSPDGRTIAYTSTTEDGLPIYAIPQLTTVDVKSGESSVIEALREVQVFQPGFAPDGHVLGIAESHGEQNLVRVDVSSGEVESLVRGQDVVSEYRAASDGIIYALVSRPQHPQDIFAIEKGELRQLSFVNRNTLNNIAVASVEKHTFTASDGTELDTFVTFPPHYKAGKRYPGVLHIHGGPQSQWNYGFDYEAQLLAAQGYVVVMPNPRGSFGYGQAFAEAIYQDWGGVDYGDVMASMDFAIEKGWVDQNRMAVYGWSYGGMMTNHVITKTDRFKAAITGASATLYMANYGHDQYQRWWEEELGLPWLPENREKWDRISPFFSLHKVTTPTLIVGGEHDWNVPIINSEQLYIGLKRQGIPTELVVYPGEGHLLSVPSYEKDLYERYFKWLERYVRK